MSKYNNIKSIPIDSLQPEELKIAIKEWSEGDENMEKLLWSLYKNNIKTSGCHAGKYPYVEINYDSNQKETISNVIKECIKTKGSQVLICPDGGNPFSGPDWYKPSVSFGSNVKTKEEAGKFYNKIQQTIEETKNQDNDLDFLPILQLLDFLIGKISQLSIRINHYEDDTYHLSIESSFKKDNGRFQYIDNLLSKNNLIIEIPEIGTYRYWNYNTNQIYELIKKIKEVAEQIINNYTWETPNSEKDAENLKILAHIKRKKSIEETGDTKQFEKWLKIEYKKFEKTMYETKKSHNE